MATDYTLIRHAYRLAVETGGETLVKYPMLAKLKEAIWPSVPFASNIPDLVPYPATSIWDTETRTYVDNPEYLAAIQLNQQAIEDYLAALKTVYPTARFVLQAFNTKLGYWTVDEPDNPQWEGFVRRTIGLTKAAALRKLCGL